MVVMLEAAPPFRWRLKVERFGPLVRVIWGWFSVSYIAAGVNEVGQAFRIDEREYWQRATAILLVSRSGLETSMTTAEGIAATVAESRANSEVTGA